MADVAEVEIINEVVRRLVAQPSSLHLVLEAARGVLRESSFPRFAGMDMYQFAYSTAPSGRVEIPGLEAARSILEEAAARLSEDLKLAEQLRAQLAEVDEIIERLARDREEINSLKEESRSNISELQRMIAA